MARKSGAAKRATRKAEAHAVQAGVTQQPTGAQDGAADGVERGGYGVECPGASVQAVVMDFKEERRPFSDTSTATACQQMTWMYLSSACNG